MKRALRFTLLMLFAAAGIGLAVSVALRTEPGAATAAWLSPWEATPVGVKRDARGDFMRAGEHDGPQEMIVAPDRTAGASVSNLPRTEDTSAVVSAPAPPAIAAPAAPLAEELIYHLGIAQQMGRIEEKLRRAEEFAERQQRSLETVLATFQQQEAPSAQNAALRQPFAPPGETLPQEVENATPAPSLRAPVEPLPAPPNEMHILPDEGDGLLTLNLRNSDLRQVLELLSEQHGLNIIASPTVQGAVTARLTNVDAHAALDAVLKATGFVARPEGNVIYVATPNEFLSIDQAHDHINTRVYRPNYITAAEMQMLLTPFITPDVGVVSVSTPAQVGIPTDNAQAGGDSFGGTDVVLVQDYESVLRRIDQLLLEIDTRPLQVAIESMIVTVTLNDTNNLGVNFGILNDNSVLASGAQFQDLATLPFQGGLKFGFLNSSMGAFVQALETVGDTNVVAAPRVMVLNKQRAEVHIGQDIGYLTTTNTETATTQTVEFLKVGTQLRIRPFISSDGMIRLEVHPELSTGTADGGIPNKTVTEVTTNIMCPDGATVVIGGLIREDLTTNSTQIPVLGALPWVGGAFRQRRETLGRTETLVLLTPRVVSNLTAAAEGAHERSAYLRRQDVRYDKMNPLAQRYYGKQYLRKARAAWSAGDPSVALRYANLAIHFDPENLESINLRAEIVQASGVGDQTVEAHLREGLAPLGHPHHEYSRLGFPWQRPPEPVIVVGEPPDPGRPGKIRNLHDAHEGPATLVDGPYAAPLEEVPEGVLPEPPDEF